MTIKAYEFESIGDLKAVDGNILHDQDFAFIAERGVGGSFAFYALNANSGLGESLPDRVVPSSNPGNKVWERKLAIGVGANLKETLTAGTGGIPIYNAAYIKVDGTAGKALANNIATSYVLGIAPAAIAEGQEGDIITYGPLEFLVSPSPGWVPGYPIYLDPSNAGQLTQIQPSVSGQQVVIVGIAKADNIIFVNPSSTIIEVK